MAIFDFLFDIGLDRETINQLRTMLEQNRGLLQDSRPTVSTEGSFGGSASGLDLDAQTATAHQHVVEALEEMMAGLEGYAVNVDKFGKDIFGLDEEVQAALRQGTQEAESYSNYDNFHDNGIAPPSRDDGGPDGQGGDQGGDQGGER